MAIDVDARFFERSNLDGAALMRAYRRWGFARVTLFAFVAMDVSFKCLVVPAFHDLLPAGQRRPA